MPLMPLALSSSSMKSTSSCTRGSDATPQRMDAVVAGVDAPEAGQRVDIFVALIVLEAHPAAFHHDLRTRSEVGLGVGEGVEYVLAVELFQRLVVGGIKVHEQISRPAGRAASAYRMGTSGCSTTAGRAET